MAESTELVALDKKDAMAVFTSENGMQPLLAEIRKHIDAFTGDVATKEGRAAIASMAHKVSRSKTFLESFGKACADEAKEIPRKIDRNRKLMKDTLDLWRDEVRKPLTEWEEADEERIKAHVAAIEILRRMVDDCSWMTLPEMRSTLAAAEAFKSDLETQQEFAVEYEHMNARLAKVLRRAIPEREQAERDAAELAELRRQKEEREAQEAAEKAAREAEERKRLEAEAAQAAAARAELAAAQIREREAQEKANEERLRADRERLEAEERAQQLIREKEEADRRAAETEARVKREAQEAKEREEAEAAKREANKRHVAKVHKAAVDALCGNGLDVTSAVIAIDLIAASKVPSVSISY